MNGDWWITYVSTYYQQEIGFICQESIQIRTDELTDSQFYFQNYLELLLQLCLFNKNHIIVCCKETIEFILALILTIGNDT